MASKAILFEASGLYAPSRTRLSARTADALLMLLAALALRCWWFGNPVVQIDEQFYLLVGDRMWHGAVPFIDIWDRKPLGLFLIYAAIRLLGGSGIIEYQMVACACAALAAFLVVRMARLYASEGAARLAGVASLIWLIVFDGEGGQSPIFYNPIVAGAAALTLMAYRSSDPRRIGWAGIGAMALMGFAIQVKYTAMFEGLGLGLVLLWTGWRERIRLPRLAGLAALWVALALVPTLLVMALYANWGDMQAFLFANFISIGQRGLPSKGTMIGRLLMMALKASPLIIAAIIAMRGRFEGEAVRVRRFALGWLAAAVVELLSIGTFHIHYFLPVVPPLALVAAPAFDRVREWRGRSWRPAIAVLIIGVAIAGIASVGRFHKRGDGREVQAMASIIRPKLNGCLYVFDGEPILYQMTHACFVTRYVFPSHLSDIRESTAIGADPLREIARVMDRRPSIVVTSSRPPKNASNHAAWALMRQELTHDYALVGSVPINRRLRLIYQRVA